MKYKYLQKRLIKIAIICGSIIVLCVGGSIFTSGYKDSVEEDFNKIQGSVSGADAQYQNTEKDVGEAYEAMKFYDTYSTSEDGDEEKFRKDYVRSLLLKIKEEMQLIAIEFSMEPFKKIEDDKYKNKTVAVFGSDVKIQFSSNSDVDAYNLIKNIGLSFPGSIVVNEYKITKSADITGDLLTQVSEGKNLNGVVSGNIVFRWQTIRDNPDADAAGNQQQNGMPGAAGMPGQPGQPMRPGMQPPGAGMPPSVDGSVPDQFGGAQ